MLSSWYTKMRLSLCSLERRASRLIPWVLGYLPGLSMNKSWCMSTLKNILNKPIIGTLSCSKKFNWSAVQMYDIRFQGMCAHHSCSFITMDQALITTILDATAVKTSAQKCFRCGSFDCLIDGCPIPQAALLEMAETNKKGIQVRRTAKSGPFTSTILKQTDRWSHNGREGCNKLPTGQMHIPLLQTCAHLLQL